MICFRENGEEMHLRSSIEFSVAFWWWDFRSTKADMYSQSYSKTKIKFGVLKHAEDLSRFWLAG